MCLQVFMVPALPNRISAARLSEASGLRVEKHPRPVPGSLHVSVDGGCSCSLMSDNADWSAPIWALDPRVLEGLARALRMLNDEVGGFTFQASWINDEPETRSHVQLRELLKDVLNNQVKNKHLYLVGKSARLRAS